MRMNNQILRVLGTVSLLALAFASAGCHSDRPTGQVINDSMTAHNVKSALSHDPMYKFEDVDVKVYNGNAELTGFVNSDQQRTRAAEVAAHVPGISQVINEIMLKPTPTGPAAIRDVTRDPNLPPSPTYQPPPNQVPPPPR